MKHAAFALALVLAAAPAHAQLGGLNKALGKAQDAKKKADTVADLHFTDQEERQLGDYVSQKLIDRFGVYQDQAVTKYVTLVGTVLAQASPRPALNWQFIVLDSDGVNAYAAPGGLIHITRGALGLIKNESELAGVLGHEIAHVTEKHTIRAIQKAGVTGLGLEAGASRAPGGGLAAGVVQGIGSRIYADLFENKFDRGDEMESDRAGARFANKVGYAPNGMVGFLTKISERNKDQKEPNGLFASHPQIKDRISAIEKTIRDDKLTSTATVAPRYAATIKIEAVPATAVAMDVAGVRGAVGDSSSGTAAAKKEEPKPQKKGLLGGLGLTKGSQAQSSQTTASAGSRGASPDRDAKGGSNKNKVPAKVTPAEIDAFRKGIA